ncbi:MAG: UDP-N-acetylglucosamine 2-epimerase, partial [Agathobacter sp.]|nr:UDP-N-acetylglucosamine 2-epimerase [Agathobacter sp.]
GTIGFADALARLQPDIMVLLGDRFEALAAAQTAMILRIPIAHIHGGEATEGLIDEAIRHSITKMSLLHFTAAEEYRHRVIQLGEEPSRVYNFGAIGLDNIKRLTLLTRKTLEVETGFKFQRVNFLVTYHPVTLSSKSSEDYVKELLNALDSFEEAGIIFTQANADTSGRIINKIFKDYVNKHQDRMIFVNTLGQLKYLSAIQYMDAVVGNSSSGVLEVPSFNVPTVNIGPRQNGRLMAKSVITCGEKSGEIAKALNKAVSSSFKNSIKKISSPYGSGGVSEKIVNILKTSDLSNERIMKKFYNIEMSCV